MLKLRIFSATISIIGLLVFGFSLLLLLGIEQNLQTLEALQRAGSENAKRIDISTFRIVLYGIGFTYFTAGTLALAGGVGMLFRKDWGRKLSIINICFLFAVNTYFLVVALINQNLQLTNAIFFAMTYIILLFSAFYLTRPKTKSLLS